jgi:hypothetical protein
MSLYTLTVRHVDWRRAYLLVNRIVRCGAPVRWLLDEMTTTGTGAPLPRGSFVLGDAGPSAHDALIEAQARLLAVLLEAVPALVPGAILSLRAARVAVYGGGGAPFHHLHVLRSLGFDAEPLMPEPIRAGALSAYDALVLPGGGWHAMAGELAPLGNEGCRSIASWVRDGGLYLGSCAGSYIAAVTPDSFCRSCPEQRELQLANVSIWNAGDPAWGGLQSPGIGVLEAEVVAPADPVTFNLPRRFRITHYNGPLFTPLPDVVPGASPIRCLARVRGAAPTFTAGETFLDSMPPPAERLVDRASRDECFNVVNGTLGKGEVLLCGSHPEFGCDLSLDGVEDGALLLANALFRHCAVTSAPRESPETVWPALPVQPAAAWYAAPLGRLVALAAVLDAVSRLPRDERAWWLQGRYSLSLFGATAPEVWSRELDRMRVLVADLGTTLAQGSTLLDRIRADEQLREHSAVFQVLRDTIYRPDPAWHQDGGYRGLDALLEETISLLESTLRWAREASPPPPPIGAYDDPQRNPYHLAVGSYLSAAGVLTGASLLARSQVQLLEDVICLRDWSPIQRYDREARFNPE